MGDGVGVGFLNWKGWGELVNGEVDGRDWNELRIWCWGIERAMGDRGSIALRIVMVVAIVTVCNGIYNIDM